MESIAAYREKVLNGPIGKTMLWLGIPLMVFQLVNVSYNLADAYWLSKYSEYAYAAPRQVWPFFMFINAIAQGLAAANMALISQAIGAKDYEYAKQAVSYFITATLLINSLAAFIFYIARPWIFTYIIATPPEIYPHVMDYSAIIALDLLLAAFTISYGTIFQAAGDTRTPSRIGLVSSLLNIVLDPFFISGLGIGSTAVLPAMGAAGAAIATVLSRLVGFIILLRVVRRRFPELTPRLTLKVEREWIVKSFKIGTPVSLMMMTNSLAFMVQNRLINLLGAHVASAAAIGFIIMDLADAALWGFTTAVSTMTGQAIGAGLERRARAVASRAMLYIGLATTGGVLVVYPLRIVLIQAFTSTTAVIVEADSFIKIFMPSLPFFAIFFIGMAVGRGSGHTLYPTVLGIVRLWIVRIALGYVLAYTAGIGSTGLWLAMSLSNFVAGLAIIPWILNGKWTTPVIRKKLSLYHAG